MFLLKTLMMSMLVMMVTCYDGPQNHIDLGPESGPGWAWTEWSNQCDCSVLCGAQGVVRQSRFRKCFNIHETCFPANVQNFRIRMMPCTVNRRCGDRCPMDNKRQTYFPHPTDAMSFYQCSWGVAYLHRCPRYTVWNQDLEVCDWPRTHYLST